MNRSPGQVLIIISGVACATLLLSHTADAYVGPGAGLSLLGALWALVVAIGAAVAFIVAWPIRRMRRRKREERELAAAEEHDRGEDTASSSPGGTDERRPRAAPAQEATEPRRP
jgi:membrane protein implicated in regulation of membrane protease activity